MHAIPLLLFFGVVYAGLVAYRKWREWPDPKDWKSTIGRIDPR